MRTPPKVTVVIPVYNREKYVTDAIESILTQQFTDFELLLIDDGSTDRSVEIMRSYTADPRVHVMCHESNLGIPKARHTGLALAQGTYLAMLDSDDIAHPARLNMQVDFLDRHPDYALVGTWTGGMNAEGRPLRKLRLLPVSPGEVRSRLLFQCCPAQSSIMARTSILQEYGYREHYTVSSDFDLWVRLAKRYKLGNLPVVLVRSRMHGDRITHEKAQLVKEACLQIISPQLTDLGVTFSPTDLDRHFLLLRMTKRRFIPDRAYLNWSEAWLRELQAANAHTPLYPSQPFARQLGQIWFLVCWRATTQLGRMTWKHFWRSPLSRAAWSSVRRYCSLLLFRTHPERANV